MLPALVLAAGAAPWAYIMISAAGAAALGAVGLVIADLSRWS